VMSMDPADVIVVDGSLVDESSRVDVGSTVVESPTVGESRRVDRRRADRVDESSVYDLPDEEQNSTRLYDLYLGGSCAVRKALQEVSCAP
jgi:hypothetical protein